MLYRLTFILVLSLSWLITVSCQQKGNGGRAANNNNTSLTPADTVYTISSAKPSFRQSLKEVESVRQKKFVRITATEIINSSQLAITFDLYYIAGDKTEFIGSVAPFPANNPGSFIIATGGKLDKKGELELRLKIPEDWNKKDRVEAKMKTLTFE